VERVAQRFKVLQHGFPTGQNDTPTAIGCNFVEDVVKMLRDVRVKIRIAP